MRTQPICNCLHSRVKRWLAECLLFSITPFESDAQTKHRKTQPGVFTGIAGMAGFGINPQLGFVYERKFSKHSSREAGVSWLFSRSRNTGFTETANKGI